MTPLAVRTIRPVDGIVLVLAEIPEAGVLSTTETGRAVLAGTDGIASPSRRLEKAVSLLLVRQLFGADTEICHYPSGRPYLVGMGVPDGLQFSLSHCREHVLVGYSREYPLGVDAEVIGPRVVRVAERVFSENELIHTGSNQELCTLAWTAKEAVFKLIPEHGIDFRADIRLDLRNVAASSAGCGYKAVVRGHYVRLVSYVDHGLCLTVAVFDGSNTCV